MSLSEEATGRIKIIKIPDGEAPLWIREAWVGLILPCFPYIGRPSGGLTGILSDEEVEDSRRGVIVPQGLAIAEIAKQHDEQEKKRAADWWLDNGFGGEDEYFFFFEDEIAIVYGVTEAPVRVCDDMETGHWEVPGMR